MLLNLVLFPIFTFFFYSIGNIIYIILEKNYFFFFKKKNAIKSYFFEKLLYSIFFLGFLAVIFNFFSPLDSLIFRTTIIIILLVSFLFIKKLDFQIFINNIFLILILSLLPGVMVPGYDAALYHIPYQSWIKNYELLLGFSSLNFRFALGSFYNYISAILWIENSFLFVSYFSTLFYLIFFLFLKEFLSENFKKIIFSLLILFTLPLWTRYIFPSFSLVDAPFGILSIIFLSLFFFKLKIWTENGILRNEIFLLIVILSLLIGIKLTGIFFIPLIIYLILFNVIKRKKNNFLILPSLILIIFLCLWFLRSFIISGCFVYPLNFSCFNVAWFDAEVLKYTVNEIGLYTFKPFKLAILNFKITKFLILSFLITIILLYAIFNYIKFNLNKFSKFNYIYISILLLCYIALIIRIEDLRGFSVLVESQKHSEIRYIILSEIFNIVSFFFLSFLFVFLVEKKNILKFNKNILLSNYSYIFYYLIFLLLIWGIKAPHPRFAYGYIPLIVPMLFILLFDLKEIKTTFLSKNYNKIILIFVLFFTLNEIKFKNFNIYDFKILNDIKVEKRLGFGTKPLFQNLCWNSKDCYIGSDKKISDKNIFFRKIID
tara:strand:- start:1449 stop:3251 length:1803 start_codon:yes stop_codon:yes gene_type:complete